MKKATYIIYKTVCLENNKIYVGQHKTSNLEDGYLGSGKLIKRAIEKYGKDKFKREILCEVDSFLDARIQEEFWIEKLNSTNKTIGYNITKYAWGGQPIAEETRKKISKSLKGKKRSENTKNKMRKPKSSEAKASMQLGQAANAFKKIGKSWYFNPSTLESRTFHANEIPENWKKGRPNFHFNNVRTDEANSKRSRKLTGKLVSEPTRKRISDSLMGHQVSSETRNKISCTLKEFYNEKISDSTKN